MRYDQIIYYPPFERHSLLLYATSGCSYNRCAFCNMYKTVDFEVIPLRQVIADLRDAAGWAWAFCTSGWRAAATAS